MLSECPGCCGTGYQDQSTRCYLCNGKGFRLEINSYEVTQATDEALDNNFSTKPQRGTTERNAMKLMPLTDEEVTYRLEDFTQFTIQVQCLDNEDAVNEAILDRLNGMGKFKDMGLCGLWVQWESRFRAVIMRQEDTKDPAELFRVYEV